MLRRNLLESLALTPLAASARAQSAAEGPIRIAILADMAGPTSDYSGKGAVAAVRMAAEEFGYTVAGRPIEILAVDHRN